MYGRIIPEDPMRTFYLKAQGCTYQSSTFTNYVRRRETALLEGASGGGVERVKDR